MPIKSVYLPSEGLQGENIPSHVIWQDMSVESIQIVFQHPLDFKAVFNSESWEVRDTTLIIRKVEWDGYLGLLFKSSKSHALEEVIPVEYVFHLSDGNVIKETKEIKLFKPQLELKKLPREVTIDPDKEFVKNRIRMENIGRGVIMLQISATTDSPTKLVTPPSQREFLEKFESDLIEEITKLVEEFPQFESVINEIGEWEGKNILELSLEERNNFQEYMKRLLRTVANNADFLQGFVEAYIKAFSRNTELLKAVERFIKIYESSVSKDILLVNPFDEIALTGRREEITLRIAQTDRVLDNYKDIILPKFELLSPKAGKIPVYRLFEWR